MRIFILLCMVVGACSTDDSSPSSNHKSLDATISDATIADTMIDDATAIDGSDGMDATSDVSLDDGGGDSRIDTPFEARLRRCGNGIIDDGELCDPGLFSGCDGAGACFKCNQRCNQWSLVQHDGSGVPACIYRDGRGRRDEVIIDAQYRSKQRDVYFGTDTMTPKGSYVYTLDANALIRKTELDYRPRNGQTDAIITFHRDEQGRVVRKERDDPIDDFPDFVETWEYSAIKTVHQQDNEADGVFDTRNESYLDEFGRIIRHTHANSSGETFVTEYTYPDEHTKLAIAYHANGEINSKDTITFDEYGNEIRRISRKQPDEFIDEEIVYQYDYEVDSFGNRISYKASVVSGPGYINTNWSWDFDCYDLAAPTSMR